MAERKIAELSYQYMKAIDLDNGYIVRQDGRSVTVGAVHYAPILGSDKQDGIITVVWVEGQETQFRCQDILLVHRPGHDGGVS